MKLNTKLRIIGIRTSIRREYQISRLAICENENIGKGTKIWAFSHVLPGAIIGRDCNICENVFIENEVIIGDRVTIKNGVQIWDGIIVEDDVFIGPNATFSNDRYPRSKNLDYVMERTIIKKGASIGANATVLPGILIGEGAMVGAGAVVTRNVPAFSVVIGNPATVVRLIDSNEAFEK